jgi:hypothetical protein
MLENLKIMLGIALDDTSMDERLRLILANSTSRLKLLLGGVDDVPETMEYIILEVATARYNRVGSEGLSSHAVEGETLSFTENDFSPYMDEIQAYLDAQNTATRGKVRFL